MIGIVSGTNRSGSNTLKIAKYYLQLLDNEGVDSQLIDLMELPKDVAFSEAYGKRSAAFASDFAAKVENSDKFVFIIPEYNGGFPGILKLFIDCLPPSILHHKRAGLVGLSSGASGALRALDQFGNVLNYLRVDVIAERPKLSGIERLINDSDELIDDRAQGLLAEHARRMISL